MIENDLDPPVIDQHPVLRDAFVLPSRPVEEFVNRVLVWLENLLPGGLVWGFVRMGKTQAARYLIANAERLLGAKIPCYLLSAWDTSLQPVTDNRFFQEILYAIGYKLPETGTAAIKRRRAIDYMVQCARIAGEHRSILFIDEAQWLTLKQFRCLMDMHNQLKLADVRLIVILIGQPELVELKASLRSSGKGHIVGRFMTSVHRFEGISQYKDLIRLLWAVDQGSEYPTGSGISYTAHFVPEAYLSGFRLEANARAIWDVLNRAVAAHGFARVEEYPMQGVTAMLRALLQELSRRDASDLTLEECLINEVIEAVALEQIIDHLIQAQPSAKRLARAA